MIAKLLLLLALVAPILGVATGVFISRKKEADRKRSADSPEP